jgi:hypothetical protein
MYPTGFPHQGHMPFSYAPPRPAPSKTYITLLASILGSIATICTIPQGRHLLGTIFQSIEKKFFSKADCSCPTTQPSTGTKNGKGPSGDKKNRRSKWVNVAAKKPATPTVPLQADSFTIVTTVTSIITYRKEQPVQTPESSLIAPEAQADSSFVKAVYQPASTGHEAAFESVELSPADIH